MRNFADQTLRVGDDVLCQFTVAQCNVVWGAPAKEILPIVDACEPDITISFGEARNDFRIETVARCERSNRLDNESLLPFRSKIVEEVDDDYGCCFDADRVAQTIADEQPELPLVLSSQAGQYLCDEMFFTLGSIRLFPCLLLS